MGADADLRVAARQAAARHRWAEAYGLLGQVEEPTAPDLELLADVAQWSGHGRSRLDLLERAAAGYVLAEDRRGAARANLKLCRIHFEAGNLPVAGGCLRQAGALLADVPESPEHAFLMWNLARAAMNQGDFDVLRARVTEAIELARRVGNRDVEALGTLDLGHALLAAGQFEEGRALMDEANAAATSGLLDPQTTGTIYCSTIWSCRNLGDWPRAAAWTEASLRWCDREGVSGFSGQCRFHRAEVLRMRGDYDDAEADARVAIEELRADRAIYAGWGYMEVGEINRRRGDWAAAEAAFEAALGLGTDPQPGWALLRLAQGDGSGARAMIERVLSASDVIAREERVLCLPAAVTIAVGTGDLAGAGVFAEELRALSVRLGTPHGRAAAAGADGEVALAHGHFDVARARLREAWEAWCEAEAPYEAARTRLLLGRAHHAGGDDPAARLEGQAALATFERIGAHGGADEARRFLRDLSDGDHGQRVRTTFVFVDMVGSTPLVELLGDDAWGDLLAWYERTLGALFEVHGGTVVKQEGDGFFVTFPGAEPALACAVDIHRGLAAHRRDHGFAPRVRIGMHTSDAHRRQGDYAGIGVHTAARIAAHAQAEEIVASVDTLADIAGDYRVSDQRGVALKGISRPVELVTVAWR